MTLDGDTACCRYSVTGVCADLACVMSRISLDLAKMLGHAASAADQCASLLDEAVETVALSLELPSKYLSFAVLFILLWKKESKSGRVLQGKRRRLDIEDIVPTLTADAADDNVEDRSLSVCNVCA